MLFRLKLIIREYEKHLYLNYLLLIESEITPYIKKSSD
ncbi:hypothetical protein GASC598I20_009160 [Gilliamella apicola SCGC AB-598-I20]|nr:hypothetical protein GASC598I20_009160 [Gilliamella apicola SCGC AB-598-I20]